MAKAKKEYIVTLKDYNSLDGFYSDMESDYSFLEAIPSRAVECVNRRPLSRNTHYLLTDDEARTLTNDLRVEAVTVRIKNLSTKTELHAAQLGVWNRGPEAAVNEKNWGLYRCQLDENIPLWGSEGGSDEEISRITINATGKNVDIVVVDETIFGGHSEFSSRLQEYDWFGQHDLAVKATGTVITNVSRAASVATITTQTAHGLTAGNYIIVTCTSDNSFSSGVAVEIIDVPSSTTFTYSNAGGTVVSTSATGSCIGEYRYTNFSEGNNHASHVAGIVAGETQGWARDSNIYNLRHESTNIDGARDSYSMSDFLIDYIREFHADKSVNPETGRKNPTLVNNSWGFGADVYGLTNFYTGNSTISRFQYRGSTVLPSGSSVDTGISGIFTSSAKVADMNSVAPGSGNRIATTGITAGTVTSTTYSENGRTGLVDEGNPDASNPFGIDSNDDAYWAITLPFNITYLTQSYGTIYVGSNSYLTFGAGRTDWYVDQSLPIRKIFVSSGDRNCESVWTGTFGTAGSRTFVIRWEGFDGAYGSLFDPSPNTIWEAKFYEATPNQIDIQIISNANYRAEFTVQELEDYGLNVIGPAAPFRNTAMDADIADAIDEGIIFVGSAGNSSTKIDISSGQDYNNYLVDNGLPIYYHRGSSPGATDGVICVGESSGSSTETKSQVSNTGPRVDLYAPGTNIMSAVYDTLPTGSNVINDGSASAELSSASAVSGLITMVTAAPHNFLNGDTVTIIADNPNYTASRVTITYIDSTSFSYTGNVAITESSAPITGNALKGYLYQKSSGTSMATAQITGLLALALEAYPWMTQSDARNYILGFSKQGVMEDTAGGYTDISSLQGGNNKFAFYRKERQDQGILVPKSNQWLRPSSGLLFPRSTIRKK